MSSNVIPSIIDPSVFTDVPHVASLQQLLTSTMSKEEIRETQVKRFMHSLLNSKVHQCHSCWMVKWNCMCGDFIKLTVPHRLLICISSQGNNYVRNTYLPLRILQIVEYSQSSSASMAKCQVICKWNKTTRRRTVQNYAWESWDDICVVPSRICIISIHVYSAFYYPLVDSSDISGWRCTCPSA